MTHRADPVEVIGDGSWARCSCGKAVQRVLIRTDLHGDALYRHYRWKHADARSAMVPEQLRGLA